MIDSSTDYVDERLKYDDLPENLKTHKNRTSFVDRFKVVEGDMDHCHTILAHLSKDGHYFIHPDIEQHRSLTVRELSGANAHHRWMRTEKLGSTA